jgi:hypothetical protein
MSSLSPSSLGVREREKIAIVYYTFLPGSPADSPFSDDDDDDGSRGGLMMMNGRMEEKERE